MINVMSAYCCVTVHPTLLQSGLAFHAFIPFVVDDDVYVRKRENVPDAVPCGRVMDEKRWC